MESSFKRKSTNLKRIAFGLFVLCLASQPLQAQTQTKSESLYQSLIQSIEREQHALNQAQQAVSRSEPVETKRGTIYKISKGGAVLSALSTSANLALWGYSARLNQLANAAVSEAETVRIDEAETVTDPEIQPSMSETPVQTTETVSIPIEKEQAQIRAQRAAAEASEELKQAARAAQAASETAENVISTAGKEISQEHIRTIEKAAEGAREALNRAKEGAAEAFAAVEEAGLSAEAEAVTASRMGRFFEKLPTLNEIQGKIRQDQHKFKRNTVLSAAALVAFATLVYLNQPDKNDMIEVTAAEKASLEQTLSNLNAELQITKSLLTQIQN